MFGHTEPVSIINFNDLAPNAAIDLESEQYFNLMFDVYTHYDPLDFCDDDIKPKPEKREENAIQSPQLNGSPCIVGESPFSTANQNCNSLFTCNSQN
ncbi:hypothetical protein M9Y10_003030 [Tritrichomonas musculus]|uniref:Uncharacterized protein n=1 Tax=Tritrichomonas musculus TaxID=1915356 RepID=A0ABR2JNW4_9EUKA